MKKTLHKIWWENRCGDSNNDPFGNPSPDVGWISQKLHKQSLVLDAGCGEGRNALLMAKMDMIVDAFDISKHGLANLQTRAKSQGLIVRSWKQDICSFEGKEIYDCIICKGVLHFLTKAQWKKVIPQLMASTRPGGWNMITVFANDIPTPNDMKPFLKGLFEPGKLQTFYRNWIIEKEESYIFEDNHPGGIHHKHSLIRIIARKPEMGVKNKLR